MGELSPEAQAIFKEYMSKVKRGICPHCGEPYKRQQKVRRSTYIYPCGDRLWQGKPMMQQQDGTWRWERE